MYRNDRAHERRLQASYAKTRVALIDYNLYVSRGSVACTRVFLARVLLFFSLFPSIGGRGEKKGGEEESKGKKNDALVRTTKFLERERGTARSACALADCLAN